MHSIRAVGTALVAAALPFALSAQQRPMPTTPPMVRATQVPVAGALAALGSPPNPKVAVAWDRFYDHAGIMEISRRLAAGHPNRIKIGSIGKSTQGRDMVLLTVTNFDHGNADKKPAMWIDGNIHSNEIQGSEFSLYTAWYLAEMADRVPAVDSLLDQYTLYIVPTINPDARDHYMHRPNTANSPRTGLAPRDSDGDGKIDEDNLDDLNGDGHITQMRRKNVNGRFKVSPEDPRLMIPVRPGEKGEYDLLGQEGFDNDGDGFVNEDTDGGYDPNRNWPWRWVPQYVQGGADFYPGSLVETRNVMEFVIAHPNIAGAQSYHNSGGMILRGPGVPQDEYRPADIAVFDQLGRTGEEILPGYRYMIVWKDLYTAWGGELDWFYGARGILTFSNELWTPFLYFYKQPDRSNRYQTVESRFNSLLLMGEAMVEWQEVDHPQYGKIEIGGTKKNFGRVEPGFMLQSDAHRNMMFTLYQTSQMPLVRVDSVTTRSLGGGLTEVTAVVTNDRLAPTHTQQDLENDITRPDFVSIEGGRVIAGFTVDNPLNGDATEQKREPAKIRVRNIPGNGLVRVRWIVSGSGPFTVTADSEKGGVSVLRSR
ncbi:MAG: M14 family metallopeptidase [Gemmatimonadaceae bacterium]